MALVGQRYLMAIGGNDGKPLHDLLSIHLLFMLLTGPKMKMKK